MNHCRLKWLVHVLPAGTLSGCLLPDVNSRSVKHAHGGAQRLGSSSRGRPLREAITSEAMSRACFERIYADGYDAEVFAMFEAECNPSNSEEGGSSLHERVPD